MQEQAAIELRGIQKSFARGRYRVFSGVDLSVQKSKILFVLGPSGVGKSVLLKHILGLLEPDRGEVFVFGKKIPYRNPSELSEFRKHFGVLFQGAALFDDMTVFQNVAFPLIENQRKISHAELERKVHERLRAVGLDPAQTSDKLPNELSGGMRKRVGLARAIMLEPQILLYDEPTTGLDPITRAVVDDLIIEMNEKLGLTSIVISHDIPSALYSADKIAFLFDGKIVFYGTPDEFRRCQHPQIQGFLQSEERHRKEMTT